MSRETTLRVENFRNCTHDYQCFVQADQLLHGTTTKMFRQAVSRVAVRQNVRQFHNTRASNDLFDYFRIRNFLKKEEGPKEVEVESAKDVMKKVESSEEDLSKVSNLRVLGKPPKDTTWEELEAPKWAFQPWPTAQNNKKLKLRTVQIALAHAAKQHIAGFEKGSDLMAASLQDLTTRFNFIKEITPRLNVSIPDAVLTKATNVGDIFNYLEANVVGREFDEKQPDAVYLNPDEFEGLNVTFVDHGAESAKQAKKFKKLLDKAEEHMEVEVARKLQAAVDK